MTTKEEIKEWLKIHKKNYNWLAEKLDMTTSAVANMLSKNGVLSGRAILIIESIIGKNSPTMFAFVSARIEIGLTQDELMKFEKLAKKAGMTVEDWIVSALKYAGEHPELVKEIINAEQAKENT